MVMRKHILGKWLIGACAAAAIGVMTAFPALAGVEPIRLVFANSYQVGTILEPQVYTNTSGVEVESIDWSKDPENWKPGQKVQATVTLYKDSEDEKQTEIEFHNIYETEVPKTGDTANTQIWIILAALSIACIGYSTKRKLSK